MTGEKPGISKRLGWFVLLWLGGVTAVGLVGLLIRAVLAP